MNALSKHPSEVSDFLLRDIAKKIQLKPAEHDLAERRYDDVYKFLNKDGGNPIYRRIYPQGSMAVGATIASKLSDDEFDIDVVLELHIDDGRYTPQMVLDWLHRELSSFPSCKIVRQSRCITLEFPKMHLDVTPAILLPGPDRTSRIFHSKPACEEYTRIANPWGFAEWFKDKTDRRHDQTQRLFAKDMASEPVPEQQTVDEKSNALICLQLVKRWRNILYDNRNGRKPPSILLAKLVADNARYFPTLLDALDAQVAHLRKAFYDAWIQDQLIQVYNPTCPEHDKLSDRWPEDLNAQEQFATDLAQLNYGDSAFNYLNYGDSAFNYLGITGTKCTVTVIGKCTVTVIPRTFELR